MEQPLSFSSDDADIGFVWPDVPTVVMACHSMNLNDGPLCSESYLLRLTAMTSSPRKHRRFVLPRRGTSRWVTARLHGLKLENEEWLTTNMVRNHFIPDDSAAQISKMLNIGCSLVACFCADWCSSCQVWHGYFAQLAQEYSADCFAWLYIDKHPDMVADINLDVLPVLLIQNKKGICFPGTIQSEVAIFKNLFKAENLRVDIS